MSSHAGTILAQLYDQYVRGIDCDVIFRAADHLKQQKDAQTSNAAGTSAEDDTAWINLHCHKNVIRAASSFFDRILSKNVSEESSDVEEGIEAMLVVIESEKRHIQQLTFHKISSHSIHDLVEFAYTGCVKVETNVLKRVVEDLKLMKMQSMLDKLSSHLNYELSYSNSIFNLVLSMSFEKEEMYRKVLSFILNEFSRGLRRDSSFLQILTGIIEMQLPCSDTGEKISSALEEEAEVIGNLGLTEDHRLILILNKLIKTNSISEEDELKLLNCLITKRREKSHIHFEKIILFCWTDCEELCVECLYKSHANHRIEPVDAARCDQLTSSWKRTDTELEKIKLSALDRNTALDDLEKIISEEKLRNMSIQVSCARMKPKMDKLSDIFKSGKVAPNNDDVLAFHQFIAAMDKQSRCLKEKFENAKKISEELLSLMEQRMASCAFIGDASMDIGTLEDFEEIDLDQSLNSKNCCSVLRRAKKNEIKEAYDRAFNFIAENFMNIVKKCGTDFHRRISHSVLEDLLKLDKLKVESEDDVIVVVKEWIHFDVRLRKKFASKLLKQVRFGELSNEMLDKLDCDSCYLLTLNEESKQLLNDAVSSKCSRNPRDSTITKLLVLGYKGDNLLYDSVSCTWKEWKRQDSSTWFGAVTVSKNIFIIGGDNEHNRCQSKVSIYNVETKTWKSGPSLQQPRSAFATCVDSENTIYVLGGRNRDQGSNVLTSVELLKCDRSGEPIGDWQPSPSMNCQRYDFEAAVIDNKVYAVGGSVRVKYLSQVEVFDPKLNVWKQCRPMSKARSAHSVAIYNKELYLFSVHGDCEKYNPVTDTWTPTASCPGGGAYFRASAVMHGKIYIVRGDWKCEKTDIYDPNTNTWSEGPELPRVLGATKCVAW